MDGQNNMQLLIKYKKTKFKTEKVKDGPKN